MLIAYMTKGLDIATHSLLDNINISHIVEQF